jgi:hypothetical protein
MLLQQQELQEQWSTHPDLAAARRQLAQISPE